MTANELTFVILALFCFVPFISAYLDSKIQDLKVKINKKLKPHGLRLKDRA